MWRAEGGQLSRIVPVSIGLESQLEGYLEMIMSGEITDYVYDAQLKKLVERQKGMTNGG